MDAIINWYVMCIKKYGWPLEKVPEQWREEVKKKLEEEGYCND